MNHIEGLKLSLSNIDTSIRELNELLTKTYHQIGDINDLLSTYHQLRGDLEREMCAAGGPINITNFREDQVEK